MPLYEYQCENCGDVFELMQKFSDEPLTIHEKCGGKVNRLISAPALQFKGSGWYITDYAKGGNSAPASTKKDSSATGTSGSGESAKSSDSSASTPSTPASTSTSDKK